MLVITIPSRGRPFNTTFKLVEKANCPVYVYVHEPEFHIYKECAPSHFEIVKHNCNSIGQIRNFIQKHQAEAGNDILMLDDDIRAFYQNNGLWKASINDVLEKTEDFPDYAILSVPAVASLPSNLRDAIQVWDKRFIGVSYVLRSSVYGQGLHFEESPEMSEDVAFTIEASVMGLNVGLLPFISVSKCGVVGETYFGHPWYEMSGLSLYEKYGNIIKLVQSGNIASYILDLRQVEPYKLRGNKPVYSVKSNAVIQRLLEPNQSQGSVDPDFAKMLLKVWLSTRDKPMVDHAMPHTGDRYWLWHPYKELS